MNESSNLDQLERWPKDTRTDKNLDTLGALADCMQQDSCRNTTIYAFEKRAAIGHIYPISNALSKNFEQC